MDPSYNSKRNLNTAVILINIILAIIIVISLALAIKTIHTTGLLILSSTDSSAVFSVSRDGSGAQVVGTGSARIRLKPGTYLVAANNTNKSATKVVTITTGQTSSVNLTPSSQTPLSSLSNISFNGFDYLLSNGLTSDQVTNLEQLFFSYKQTAKEVTIDQASVEPGPHNPNDSNFTMNFTGSIDSTLYRATITYSGLDAVSLKLTNPQTNTTFFSGKITE